MISCGRSQVESVTILIVNYNLPLEVFLEIGIITIARANKATAIQAEFATETVAAWLMAIPMKAHTSTNTNAVSFSRHNIKNPRIVATANMMIAQLVAGMSQPPQPKKKRT
jgi:hypothetical protein